MLLLISPAKTLDFSDTPVDHYTEPRLLEQSNRLVGQLRKKSVRDLQQLMNVSERIASLNVERFRRFSPPFTPDNAKPAVLAFKGDVYQGLQAENFDEAEMAFAQDHLRILSGLYGVLRPLDLMQAYRLEMGTRLSNGHGKNLYEFWGDQITEILNQDLTDRKNKAVINLASREYFKAVNPARLNGQLYHVHFKEWRDDRYRIISFNAKKARGMMCRFVIGNRLQEPEALKAFDWDDYFFNEDLSSEREFVFTR